MDFEKQAALSRLQQLLAENEATAGMYARAHGKNLIMGREDTYEGTTEKIDMVRLTRQTQSRFALSYKRHTGRWERLPFTGDMTELVQLLQGSLAHMVAPL